jgi:hypothetical protein
MDFTEEETVALIRYQDNDYKVINSLLRRGYESERTINMRKGEGYPYLTKEDMDGYLSCIELIYSAILRTYQENGCMFPNKTVYRGTQTDIIESMDGEECSFLSTTTSLAQTRCFSAVYTDAGLDSSRRAVAIIDSYVPWINIDEIMGGMEDEIIFLPAKVKVTPINTNLDTKLGKTYKMTLSELDIPEKTEEEIECMRKTILDNTETMSDYLKLILEAEKDSSLNNTQQLAFATQEYKKWKELVVSYNHQQYRVLRNQIIDNVEDKKNISSK